MIWIIIAHEQEGYCGIGLNFTPEAYTTKELADARYKKLDDQRSDYCGYYYTLDNIYLDQTAN